MNCSLAHSLVTGLQICFWYKEKIVEIMNIRIECHLIDITSL